MADVVVAGSRELSPTRVPRPRVPGDGAPRPVTGRRGEPDRASQTGMHTGAPPALPSRGIFRTFLDMLAAGAPASAQLRRACSMRAFSKAVHTRSISVIDMSW
jgi:hypothetical protein